MCCFVFTVGKLPASQANSELVNAHRGEEKEKMRKLLDIYLKSCARAKVLYKLCLILFMLQGREVYCYKGCLFLLQVKASVLVTEAVLVPRGIVELVNRHCIKKLVMGAVPARFLCSQFSIFIHLLL